jgi:uncharacterized protein (TIGR02466 family)
MALLHITSILWAVLLATVAEVGESGPGVVTRSWGTPVFEDTLAPDISEALRPQLVKLAQELQAAQPQGTRKSNIGGWQSEPLALVPGSNIGLVRLADHILDAARWFVSDGLGDDMRRQRALITGEYQLEVASVWFNVNRPRDYNNPHVHTDSFISGVFYVEAGPQPSGQDEHGSVLVLSDPRVQIQQFEYFDWYGMGVQRRVHPAPGKLVMFPSWLVHRVEPVPDPPAGSRDAPASSNNDARISVSFNLVFRPTGP